MDKLLLVRLAALFLTILTLSGCILVPVPVHDGLRRGDFHEGGERGGHRDRGDRH